MERLKKPTTVASQANASYLKHSGVGSDNGLPRGLKGNYPSNLLRVKMPPLIKWKCPPRLKGIMSDWRVAAGEESSEIDVQKQRELRVLEAFYPRSSAIPSNPGSSVDNLIDNDQKALPVPIIPIEDTNVVQKDGSASANNNVRGGSTSPNNNAMKSQSSDPLSFLRSATPDIVDVAQGAVSAIMQVAVSTVMSILGSRNNIDQDLLVKILGDPKMVEQLLTSQSPAPTTQDDEPFTSFLSMMSMRNVQSSSSPARPATGMIEAAQKNMPSMSMQSMPAHMSAITKISVFDGAKASPRVLKMIDSVEVLSSLGIHLENEFLIHSILQSLPDSYSSFMMNLNTSKTKLTLHELFNEIKAFEDKTVLTVGPSAAPPGLKGKKQYQKKNEKESKIVSKLIPVNPKSGIKKKKVKVPKTCYHCKQPGHLKRECKVLEAEIKTPGEGA